MEILLLFGKGRGALPETLLGKCTGYKKKKSCIFNGTFSTSSIEVLRLCCVRDDRRLGK